MVALFKDRSIVLQLPWACLLTLQSYKNSCIYASLIWKNYYSQGLRSKIPCSSQIFGVSLPRLILKTYLEIILDNYGSIKKI